MPARIASDGFVKCASCASCAARPGVPRPAPSSTRPLVGRADPESTFINVLLPAPFSPTTAWISPARNSTVTSSSARTPGYSIVTPRAARSTSPGATNRRLGSAAALCTVRETTGSAGFPARMSEIRTISRTKSDLDPFPCYLSRPCASGRRSKRIVERVHAARTAAIRFAGCLEALEALEASEARVQPARSQF